MKNWKSFLVLALIFLMGMVAGGLVVGALAKRTAEQAAEEGPEIVGKTIVSRLTSELSLDASQKQQVADIVRDAQKEIRGARQQIQPKVRVALNDSERRIRAVLTPAQAAKFDTLIERNRKRSRAFEP